MQRSRRALRPSPLDREIFTLALPALGALAAEPLYLLVDTAIVGHLGTAQLAALALASTLLDALATFCNFLIYGVTAQVARLHGAGERERAGAVAPQALWVALLIGVPVAALAAALAPVAIGVLGGTGRVGAMATTFLRIGCIGLPCALIAMAGQGYQRGVGDLRGPLVVIVAANVVNVALELLFVYGLHWGLVGSAWGTVIAQFGIRTAHLGHQGRHVGRGDEVIHRLVEVAHAQQAAAGEVILPCQVELRGAERIEIRVAGRTAGELEVELRQIRKRSRRRLCEIEGLLPKDRPVVPPSGRRGRRSR